MPYKCRNAEFYPLFFSASYITIFCCLLPALQYKKGMTDTDNFLSFIACTCLLQYTEHVWYYRPSKQFLVNAIIIIIVIIVIVTIIIIIIVVVVVIESARTLDTSLILQHWLDFATDLLSKYQLCMFVPYSNKPLSCHLLEISAKQLS